VTVTPAERWYEHRTYSHRDFPADRLAASRTDTVSICLPARDCARTVGPMVEALAGLRDRGVVDQIVVVDAASDDGTAEVAAGAGAEVHQEAELMPRFGPPLGKGDAMWRALSVLTGDVVCYLDADTEDFGEHFACGTLGPVLCEPGVAFSKAFFRRPFKVGETIDPHGGGRVTELSARPLLNMFFPGLAGFIQPLAGEMAGRRALFERIPFACGYAVETAMLIDVHREAGLDALAQVDLEVRQNRHQTLRQLVPMAYNVTMAVASRLQREERLVPTPVAPLHSFEAGAIVARPMELVERPAMSTLGATAT